MGFARAQGMTAEDAAAQAIDLIRSMLEHEASGVELAMKRIGKTQLTLLDRMHGDQDRER